MKTPEEQVNTTQYHFAHGKAPRGSGCWGFVLKYWGEEVAEVHYPYMPYAKARRFAIQDFRSNHPLEYFTYSEIVVLP